MPQPSNCLHGTHQRQDLTDLQWQQLLSVSFPTHSLNIHQMSCYVLEDSCSLVPRHQLQLFPYVVVYKPPILKSQLYILTRKGWWYLGSVETMSLSDCFFISFVSNISCEISRTLKSRDNVWYSYNASLSFFASQKKHASVKFLAETDRLDVCRVSIITVAYSGLFLSFDRRLWLHFDEQFLRYITFFSVSFWARSFDVTKVLIRFLKERQNI